MQHEMQCCMISLQAFGNNHTHLRTNKQTDQHQDDYVHHLRKNKKTHLREADTDCNSS